MKKSDRADLEKRLRHLEESLSGRGTRRPEPNRRDEVEVVDEDQLALNEMLQTIASNRNRNDRVLLGRVQRGLAKARGAPEELGVCEECGEDIALPRLRAMPYAELCVDCQAKRDPSRGQGRRRLTDYAD